MNTNSVIQLPMNECEEWIWDTLDCTKDCGFEHVKNGDKEFLIFNANDFFVDAKALEKIKKTTGMKLVQMSNHKRPYSALVWEIYVKEKSL